MSQSDLERKFQGIWCRALNEPSLAALTPEFIMKWAGEKGLTQPSAIARDIGVFHPTPGIVLEVAGTRACFPKTPASGNEFWHIRRQRKDEEAALWEKMEWFVPLWLPMGEIGKMLVAVKHCTKERAIELFDYHTSTLYTLAF